MYADDLLTANSCERGLQQQFNQIEKTLEEDGLRISYKKTVVAVFRRTGDFANKWELNGREESAVKYLGFCAS